MSHSKWNAVNTPAGQKLDEVVIGKMTQAVHMHYKIPTHADRAENLASDELVASVLATTDIFILEKEEEFKYGKGKKVVAIADGGQNFANNTVKYVKWFNLYYTPDRQDGVSTIKVLDKTYTYGIEKARVFWNEKIKEGYNRVV